MVTGSITLLPQKSGRMIYLFLTICPVTLLMQCITWLIEYGLLPTSKFLAFVYLAIPITLMLTLGYFLIFRKNHKIGIQDDIITETSWLHKVRTISVHEIASVRRNILREISLLDADGRKLLCVEPNMTNFDQLLNWLERYHLLQGEN